jgi:hypothetical protein
MAEIRNEVNKEKRLRVSDENRNQKQFYPVSDEGQLSPSDYLGRVEGGGGEEVGGL